MGLFRLFPDAGITPDGVISTASEQQGYQGLGREHFQCLPLDQRMRREQRRNVSRQGTV